MRLDNRLTCLAHATPAQKGFLSAWFNLVHQASVDAFRVRAMNPTNITRELLYALSEPQFKREDRMAIVGEALQLFGADHVLRRSEFAGALSGILPLLTGPAGKPAAVVDGKEREMRLLAHFLRELLALLQLHYMPFAFAELKARLPTPAIGAAPPSSAAELQEIHALTAGLLSTSLEFDYRLESLYALYSQILVPRGPEKLDDYSFDVQFDQVRDRLMSEPRGYSVTFAIDQITDPQGLPSALGGITLSEMPPFELRADHPRARYLMPQPKRRFMTLSGIVARDPRSAGHAAYEKITDVVNLLRFEYEQSKLHIPNDFAALDLQATSRRVKVYPLPRVVPNPVLALDGRDAALFVQSVNELINGPHFQVDGRERIAAAFRLYREGRDQDSIETKLVNWWTALEYLVRGGQSGGGIGKSVEDALAPVLGLGYVPKHLMAVRNVLVAASVSLCDPAGAVVELRRLAPQALHDLFKDPHYRGQIHATLAREPFLQMCVDEFLSELLDPGTLNGRLERHDQRVRWQVARLWRTRCDIVHSAGRGKGYALLCSNLEYYLKTTLNGLLSALRSVPTLSGPHEYFDRETLRYEALVRDLKTGRSQHLRSYLPT